jgi:hypothetical protein
MKSGPAIATIETRASSRAQAGLDQGTGQRNLPALAIVIEIEAAVSAAIDDE